MSSRIFKKTNNPLNIRFVAINHWRGSVGEYAGFVMFSDVYYGLRAAIVLLNRYIKFGYNTPAKIISRWAPSTENNTVNYIKYVCFHAGFTRDTVITYKSDSFWKLLIWMARYETSYYLDSKTISVVLQLFKDL